MCRWMAYRGAPLLASELVLHPRRSIVAQSLDSPLGAETVNGDGFGFGWYPEPSEGGRPGVFRSIEPAWHDLNLRELTEVTRSPLFFCHVRAAAGPPIQQTNCHPFRHENWLFMHNGTIAEFGRVKRDLVMAVAPELFPSIQGTTDSEVLFHLALTLGLQQDPIAAMQLTIGAVETVGRSHGVRFPWQGTVAVSDGATIWAFRYSTQGRTRSLFHSADIGTLREMYPDVERLHLFSDEAHVVVSEPITDLPGSFIEVPEASLVVLDGSGYRQQAFNPSAIG
ncbi:MAG TPA: class II glutamine amidotransferase [Dermatophilaceae bacterium]|nr:class II glutamine amidotransferase [Dermatophilaceae bacterium]